MDTIWAAVRSPVKCDRVSVRISAESQPFSRVARKASWVSRTCRFTPSFSKGDTTFQHGYTFGGHPVSTAVAMANLDIFEREQLNEHVLETEGDFRATLKKLKDLPLVGDVRGDGYFYGIELVKDRHTKETFDDAESERLLRGFLSGALFEAGLYCRADDRGDPVVQLAPPLVCDQAHFDEMESILRDVLTRAESQL